MIFLDTKIWVFDEWTIQHKVLFIYNKQGNWKIANICFNFAISISVWLALVYKENFVLQISKPTPEANND